jgi:nucleotide-binding universal stress UspA family protein
MEFDKILVPVSGSVADAEAIRLACRLARKTKGKIWAIYVIAVRRTLPLNAQLAPEISRGEEILDRAESAAEEEDYEVETDLLQSREAGPTIIDEAVERGVNLILMGIESKRRFGQFSLGDVVPYVLKNAPCHVILYQVHSTTGSSK